MIDDPREAAKYVLKVFGLAALICLFVFLAFLTSHAATVSTQKHDNSLGVVMYDKNPNIYEAGEILDYTIIGKNEALNLRVQPLATYALYSDEILFCGVPADKLDGHENPMVLIYERVSHRMIDGIGCHELVSVKDIKGEKLK